jgi:aminomethyltransferase
MVTAEALRRTPLFECHVEAGARLVGFSGWEMPVSYKSVKDEHFAVRRSAGLFDVSHMGEIEVTGPRAAEFLCWLLTNDIEKIAPGGAQYALMCQADGGVLDDLFTYRLAPDSAGERFLSVVNAGNAEADFAWIARQAAEWGKGVEVSDRSSEYSMLALQGPDAIAMIERVLDEGSLPDRLRHTDAVVAGVSVLLCRTGYTGEDGVELLADPRGGVALWRALTRQGAQPAGLGARDTLRLEVCYPLYGNDLSVDRTPIEAGLGWACALDQDFVGAQRLREQVGSGTAERLVPIKFTGPGIPRAGCTVLEDGELVGAVTSGTLSPCLDVGIGMAYMRSDLGEPGREIEVDVRGKLRSAVTAAKPLYRRETDA